MSDLIRNRSPHKRLEVLKELHTRATVSRDTVTKEEVWESRRTRTSSSTKQYAPLPLQPQRWGWRLYWGKFFVNRFWKRDPWRSYI